MNKDVYMLITYQGFNFFNFKISTRQLCAVPDVVLSRAISPFAKLLWPLFQLRRL